MKKWWIIVLVAFPAMVSAQEENRDTVGFYHDMYHYSKEHKFLYFLYRAIFNTPVDLSNQNAAIQETDQYQFREYECHIIRNIDIVSREPFGYSLSDTSRRPHSFIQKAGNALHFKTRNRIIRNYLLFKKGDELEPLNFRESERLLRSSEFIRDADIYTYCSPDKDDSVDVVVMTQDKWTLNLSLILTSSSVKGSFTEYNMFGLGHRFKNRIVYPYGGKSPRNPTVNGSYLIPNINHTFISAEGQYYFSENQNSRGIRFDRPFYSPLANWAGGTEFYNEQLTDSVLVSGESFERFRYSSDLFSYWAGKSFRVRKGNTIEERSTRLVVSAGGTHIRYPRLNTVSDDVKDFYAPSDLYLISIGYSNRKYYTDRYIFEFGEKEDVPSGRIFSITAGYKNRIHSNDFYTGFMVGGSGYLPGNRYIAANAEYGTFIHEGNFTEGVFRADLFAFSKLVKAGKWRFRWFGNANFTRGVNRNPIEKIALSTENLIPGFKRTEPNGTIRLAMNVTMVVFNPFEFLGFRVSPLVFAGAGLIGDEQSPLHDGKLYKGIGAGFAATNIYLINSDIKLTFGYYPGISGSQTRLSSFETWQYEFRDFDFGKPATVEFK